MIKPVKFSATIITFNEEAKIADCIKSLLRVADEIIVVDSYSTDETEKICTQFEVKFIKHEFEGYVGQKNFAMKQASYDYILSLDADERISEELEREIVRIKKDWGDADGYAINRFNNYCGHWIRFCGWYPDRKIRVWDRNRGSWGGTDPHDKVILDKSRVKRLQGDLLHFAYFSIDEHLKQMSKFAEVAAKAKFKKGERPIFVIHIILNPIFKFLKKYIFQLGFLDGYYGFVFCAAASSLNFFKYLRLYEYHRRGLPD
jgi:glycosyltransferase involved in cell wall biosynthesis